MRLLAIHSKSKLMKTLLLSLSLSAVFAACGWSPLFNHVDAQARTTPESSTSVQCPVSTSECPIYLSKLSLCAGFTWQECPVVEEKSGSMTLEFWKAGDAAKTPVDPEGTVRVLPWMSSMGHGSMVAKTARLRQGVFEVKEVAISMAGEWQIKVQLRNGSSILDEALSESIEF